MSDLKVTKGDPVTAEKWNRMADRLGGTKTGYGVPAFAMSRVEVSIKNTSGNDRDIGEILVADEYDGPDTDSIYDVPQNLSLDCVDPVWHTSIAKPIVLAEPIPDGEMGVGVVFGKCLVKLSSVTADDCFVMIDPTSTNECKTSDTGIGLLLSEITEGAGGAKYGDVVLGLGSQLWAFELTEDAKVYPLSTKAKLLRTTDGDEFASEVELTDVSGILEKTGATTGTIGQCNHVGNHFVPIDVDCA